MQTKKTTEISLDDAELKALENIVVGWYNSHSSSDYRAEFKLANALIDEVFG